MELFWHRRDLRLADNLGLAAAVDRAAVAPTFVLDDDVLTHASDLRVRRLLDGLAALRDAYRDRGSDLLVVHGDATDALHATADALGVERVVWNRGYSGLSLARDEGVREALQDAGIDHEAHHDAVLHPPGTIRTNAGDPYSVYSYYWKKWRDREIDEPALAPEADALVDVSDLRTSMTDDEGLLRADIEVAVGDLPEPADLGFAEPDVSLPPAGTAAARERLDAFLDDEVFTYDADRDYPARGGTSRLSTYLAYGEVGPREVYAATERAMAAAADRPEGDAADHVEAFRGQLAWREFYTQVLYHNPGVVTANYRSYDEPIDWRNDPDEIAAWKRGETGYPIVDAGMRQLREEGFMHNRVRMIVASFLTKDLLVDWRHGYAHFRDRLADHDTANDNGGWQWAASTGTDAQPYFRIFNPMTQGERYDPDAEYIVGHVPELRGVDADLIHGWHELSPAERGDAAPEYPSPLVDHAERREAAIAMFQRARGEDPDEDSDE